ncbi:MAG: AmmeMemoRadiSam system radical SAM enzyme [Planctomycetes bacterium]|nr:AmmeMemoRadiSam system radical SAM enzyme [Planctomycetota bacterium]
MKEAAKARFYRPGRDEAVECFLCNHRCHVAEGKRGACRVRENRRGKLYSLVYGRIIASHMDPIEKKPLYHFLPGAQAYSIATPGCNFRCSFCQNWRISQTDIAQRFDSIPYVSPEETVSAAARSGAGSIAYTYTEPTIFMEYALDCAELARRRGIKNVFVTNGYQTPEAVEAMRGLIDAANVDLKAFTDEFYRRILKASLQPVLDTIANMHAAGIHLEITTLIVPTQNDSEEQLRGIAEFIASLSADIPWHISRFHPDFREHDLAPTPLATMQRAVQIGREAGLNFVYMGNVLSPEGQNTTCPGCGRTLISRSGFARPNVEIEEPLCPACGRKLPIVLK